MDEKSLPTVIVLARKNIPGSLFLDLLRDLGITPTLVTPGEHYEAFRIDGSAIENARKQFRLSR